MCIRDRLCALVSISTSKTVFYGLHLSKRDRMEYASIRIYRDSILSNEILRVPRNELSDFWKYYLCGPNTRVAAHQSTAYTKQMGMLWFRNFLCNFDFTAELRGYILRVF